MKINEVVKRTSVSKRTIYYYIEEQLITPETNKKNGYNIFTDEDVERLSLIQKLRQVDFSISDIRAILQSPDISHYYLQKHIDTLEENQFLLAEKIDILMKLDADLPVNDASLETFSKEMMLHELPKDAFVEKVPRTRRNSYLVAQFLWGMFLQDSPMTEYREFLWEKVLRLTESSGDPNIKLFKKYLYSLSADEIDKEFEYRRFHIEKIAALSPENYDAFIEKMKCSLVEITRCGRRQKDWKEIYYSRTVPSVCLFASNVNELIRELSPSFASYCESINICCSRLYKWLQTEEGQPLYKELLSVLHGFIDLEQNNHAELAALVYIEYE